MKEIELICPLCENSALIVSENLVHVNGFDFYDCPFCFQSITVFVLNNNKLNGKNNKDN